MNRKCFRLVFNRHRGVLMPVAAVVVAMSGFGGSPGASAQVRAHPDAAPHQRPTVLRTANGVPLVNFHAPSPSGVALSVLSQFDVDRPGVILNNSLYGAQTRLGGAVAANPWLDKAPARIIVNEVRSTRPSSLRGDIEVAGQRAQVVVANPAGIECDRCGFINASRATMTTGVPQFREGALQGYQVTDGVVRIGAGGLDATAAEVTDLIARAVEVRGQVLARSLQAVTGPGNVSQDGDGALVAASAAPDRGASPLAAAIDISALGGLYAGSIRLVATEAGVGVRNAGAIGAGVGSVVVTAAGQLENAGSIVAREDVRLRVAGLDSPGLLAAGIDDEDRATRPAMLAVHASADVRIAGRALAGGDIDLRAKGMDLSGGHIATTGRIGLQAGGNLDNAGGAVIAGADLTARVGQALRNEGGTLLAQGDLVIEEAKLVVRNVGGSIGAGRNLRLTLASLDNTDGRIANVAKSQGDVRLALGGVLDNTRGRIGADRDVSVQARELLGVGEIAAGRDLALALDSGYTHSENHLLSSGRDLSLRLGGDFVNPARRGLPKAGDEPLALAAVRDLRVEAANIANSGDLVAGGALTLRAGRIDNSGSLVGGSVFAQAAEELRNEGPAALIGAADEGGLLQLLAARIVNRDPVTAIDSMPTTTILGMGDVVIAGGTDAQGRYVRAQSVLNESARIVAGGNLLVAADTLTNQRRVLQAGSTYDVPMPGESGFVVYTPENPDVPGGRYIEPDHGGFWNADYIRTDYTATVARNRIEAVSPKGQVEAGGDFRPEVGMLQNYWSAITAAGSIPLNGVTVDSDSWRGAMPYSEQRTYSGDYVYRRYKGDHFTKGPWTDPPVIKPLGGYDASLTAGGSIAGAGNTLINVSGTTPKTPLGMEAGQPVGGRQQEAGPGSYDPFSLPQGGLYRVSPSPDSRYLVETHAAFTRRRSWASSDAYFREMGLDPSQVGKRLGDGFYEQQLVRSQLIALTGRAVLDAVDAQAQFAAMMSAGAQVARTLQLAPGAGLSAEQVAALTGDVVLMEARVIQGQSVLVPVVYLAAASRQQLLPTGSLIAARDVVFTDTQDFRNSGVIRASHTLVIDGTRIDNRGGRLEGGDLVALSTRPGGDIDLTSARVKAGALDIDSGGALVLATDAQQREGAVAGGNRSITRLGQEGRIDVQGDASLATAGDLVQSGSSIVVGGDLRADVGGSWRIDSLETREVQQVRRGAGHSDTQVIGQVGSRLEVDGKIQAHVAQDLVTQGATLDLRGGGRIVAGRDVVLDAAVRSEQVDSSSRSGRHSETHQQLDEEVVGTRIDSGADLAIVAGRGIGLRASAMQVDQGRAALQAGRDVNVESAEERHVLHDTHVSRQRGVLSSRTIRTDDRIEVTEARGSSLSADHVDIEAGRDLRVEGSQVVGTGDVSLRGGRDVRVDAATQSREESHEREEKRSGVFASGGLGVTIGKQHLAQEDETRQTMASGSTVGSVSGHVRIQAGETYRQVGSEALAPRGDIDVEARRVEVVEARESLQSDSQTRMRQSGVTVSLSNPVLSAAGTIDRVREAARDAGDSRMRALAALTQGLAVYEAGAKVEDDPRRLGGVSVNISLGSSRSASQSSQTSDSAAGSRLVAGGDLRVRATGAGEQSDVIVQGSSLEAGGVARVLADDEVRLLAARNQSSQHSENHSSSASVGVSYGFGPGQAGWGFNANASRGDGRAEGDEVTWTNARVLGEQAVQIDSGGDTSLRGAVVSAPQVTARVGGNLAVESLQDTARYSSQQRSSSAGASWGNGKPSAQASASRSEADMRFSSVGEQTGVVAGDGGFDVEVKGRTDLKAGILGSSDEAAAQGRNRLVTATLTASDLENSASAEASSSGVALSSDMMTRGKYGITKGVVANTMLNADDAMSAQGQTQATVSEGAIVVTDESAQRALTGQGGAQVVAALNRDAGTAHARVLRPDLEPMQRAVNAQRVIKEEAFRAVTTLTDEAYRSRFEEKPKLLRVECPVGKNCLADTKLLEYREVTPEEFASAPDRTTFAVNGILNPEDRAARLMYQNTLPEQGGPTGQGDKPKVIYVMHIAPAGYLLSELMGVAYEKITASNDYGLANFLGYTNGQELYAELLRSRGERPTDSLGHSRGTLVQQAAFTILANRRDGEGRGFVNPNLRVRGFGGAAPATEYTESAAAVIGPGGDVNQVTYTHFDNDPVSTSWLAGRNPGSWTFRDLWQVMSTSNSMHSCGGTGAPGCTQVEAPVPGGPQGTPEGNARLVRYVGGKRVLPQDPAKQEVAP